MKRKSGFRRTFVGQTVVGRGMMSKLGVTRYLALAAILLMFGACAALPTTAAPNNQELTIAYYLEPDTLNPYGAHNPAGSDMHINEGLATTDDKMRYIALEAQQIPSPDNGGAKMVNGKLVVTWKLKPGLKWSDGQPATSADAVFTAKALQDPSFITDNREGWALIDSVDAPDPL